MKRILLFILCGFLLPAGLAQAQNQEKTYSLLIKGGHVIDAKNKINTVMDVAIRDGKIAAVAKNIDAALASQVVDAKGMYVTPGSSKIHSQRKNRP